MPQTARERAILVGVDVKRPPRRRSADSPGALDPQESLEELATLAESAGASVVERLIQTRPAIDPATLVGAGKVSEIAALASASEADLVLFDRELVLLRGAVDR